MSAPAGSPILSAAPGLANSFASQAVTGERTNLLPGNAGAPSSSAEGAGASGSVREEDEDGLDVPIGFAYFFQGVIGDFKRRFKHQFTSDYYDGLRWQSLSAGLFTFFGVLMTTISLGHRVQDSTMGQTGFVEYMLMNSVAGIAYTLIEPQPYVVIQPTGPITMLLEMLSRCAEEQHVEFLPLVAATGLFVALWLCLCACLNVANLISYMSRFTGEVSARERSTHSTHSTAQQPQPAATYFSHHLSLPPPPTTRYYTGIRRLYRHLLHEGGRRRYGPALHTDPKQPKPRAHPRREHHNR